MLQPETNKHFKYYFDEDDILNVIFPTELSLEKFVESKKQLENMLKTYRRTHSEDTPLLCLVDPGNITLTTLERYRKEYAEFPKMKGVPDKIAFLGKNRLMWLIATFALTAGGMKSIRRNAKFFLSREKAVKWLKSYVPAKKT